MKIFGTGSDRNRCTAGLDWVWAGIVMCSVVMLIAPEARAQSVSPVEAVLVLDMSGSMWRRHRRKSVKEIFAWGVEFANDNDRVGVVTLGDKARVARELTTIEEDDLSGLLHVLTERSNRTDIASGLEQAYYMLKTTSRQGSRRVVVLFSDGKIDLFGGATANETSARYLRDILIPAMKDENVQLFAFVPEGLSADYPLLQEMTVRTDGEYFRGITKDANELRALFDAPETSPSIEDTPPVMVLEATAEADLQTTESQTESTPAINNTQPVAVSASPPPEPEAAPTTEVSQVPQHAEPTTVVASSNNGIPVETVFMGILVLGLAAFGLIKYLRTRQQRKAMSGILDDVRDLRSRISVQMEEKNDRLRREAAAVSSEIDQGKKDPVNALSVSFVTPFLEFSDDEDSTGASWNGPTDDIAFQEGAFGVDSEPELSMGVMETLIGVGEDDTLQGDLGQWSHENEGD